jgi:hypothetical protein
MAEYFNKVKNLRFQRFNITQLVYCFRGLTFIIYSSVILPARTKANAEKLSIEKKSGKKR